jgi:hypothetical protein
MGTMKNYILRLLEQCSEEKFGQDAIEWAIVGGHLPLSYDLDRDVRQAMSRYDEIIEAYRRSLTQADDRGRKPHQPIKGTTPVRRTKGGEVTPSLRRRKAA